MGFGGGSKEVVHNRRTHHIRPWFFKVGKVGDDLWKYVHDAYEIKWKVSLMTQAGSLAAASECNDDSIGFAHTINVLRSGGCWSYRCCRLEGHGRPASTR